MHPALSPDQRSAFDEAHGRRHMITLQNWSQWSALLDEALDLEGDARAQWLRELRLRRPDAAEALTRLLERDDPLIAGRHYERSLHAALTADDDNADAAKLGRSEEHTSELQSLMRLSYAVFCLKKKKNKHNTAPYNDYDIQIIITK